MFQDFNLLDTFSLQDNIYLPLVLAGTDYQEMRKKLRPIADQLGISDILTKYPYESPAARSSGRRWPGPLSRTPS